MDTIPNGYNSAPPLLRIPKVLPLILAHLRIPKVLPLLLAHLSSAYCTKQRKENRSEEAIRMLERCIRLDPAYTPAYLLLARLYSNRGVHEAVGQLLRHVATLEPESSDHMAEYATWLRDKGKDAAHDPKLSRRDIRHQELKLIVSYIPH
uniref:(California timema) hypothetical protein n=1 Tax=Timema californicum TaxID=61474 RepID=A0A7R9J3J9_TIMCA|nr:unnamed protein product [Timema californicum]